LHWWCMGITVRLRIGSFLSACFLGYVLFSSLPTSAQQQQVLGSIIGHIRTTRGGVPPQAVLVTLEFRGAAIDSVYSDSQGTFGFHNLGPSPYTVTLKDDQYEPVRTPVTIEPNSLAPLMFVDIALVPRPPPRGNSDAAPKPSGGNPNIVDVHEYFKRFPKSAVKEFQKGLAGDAANKRDEAVRHYQKAVAIAPEFYLAHNNLGSDYLSKSDFPAARREFERVVELNQSDAAAYFNLSNVCMLMRQLAEAQRYLDEGLRRQPDAALGQFLLGSLNLRLNKLPEAEGALSRAIQLDPLMAQARLQMVNLLLQQGRKEDAQSLLRDFLNTFPESSFSAQAKQVLQRLKGSSQVQGVPN